MSIVSTNEQNLNRANKLGNKIGEFEIINDENGNTNLDDETDQTTNEMTEQANNQQFTSENNGLSGLNTTTNSSGIGSIASPNSAFDPKSNNSVYTTYSSNTPSTPPSNYENNSNCDSISSSTTPGSTSKININAPIFNSSKANQLNMNQISMDLMNKMSLNNQSSQNNNNLVKNLSSDNLSSQSNLSTSPTQSNESSDLNQQFKNVNQQPFYLPNLNNFMSLPIGLGSNTNNIDYDPFNEYVCSDKQPTSNPLLEALKNYKKFGFNNIDPQQQQQQLLAQAIAAATNNSNSGNENQAAKNQQQQQKTLLENIESLNLKFLSQKQHLDQNNNNNNNNSSNKNMNLNSLLAAAASNNGTNSSNLNCSSANNSILNESMTNYNSPSPNYNKRQSSGAFMNPNMLFSTPIPGSVSPTNSNNNLSNTTLNNNRLNSTPNIGMGGNEQNRYFSRSTTIGANSQAGNISPDQINSMSASNSSFNLSNNLDIANNGNASVNSAYDDDDVFTNPSLNMNQSNSSNSNINPLLLANQSNLDPYMQLYRNLLASNLNSSNISDLLFNNSNLSNLSNDILNTNNPNNFMDLTNSSNFTFNQSKSLNQTNNSSNTSGMQLNNNNSNSSNNNLSNQLNLSPAAFAAAAAAVLKQRQNPLMNTSGNRLSTGMIGNHNGSFNSNNLTSLPAGSSNMTSFLNSNQPLLNTNNLNDPNANKRRINSIATAYNLGSSNSNPLQHNNSPMFPSASTLNVGPNASLLLQNSSLASSARLNTSASTNATASVLGNNSSLSHALNSLQHQNSSNFNSSPTPSSNQNLLSALALSASSGNSLTNTLLSSSGKPLRSERLPQPMVDEIIKQGKIRRRQGGKKEVCVFCRNNGEKEQFFASHTLKDANNNVACPILRLYQCPICHASGDSAHTIKYCPFAEKDSNCIKLFKESGRMSAAALLMNSYPGSTTPPASSPPESPSPLNQTPSQSHHLSFLNQSVSSNISSPNTANTPLSLAQALSLTGFNTNFSSNLGSKSSDLNLNLNKSFSGVSNNLNTSNCSSNLLGTNLINSNSNNNK